MNTQIQPRELPPSALPVRAATQLLTGWIVVSAGTLLIAADWLHRLV